MTERLADAGAKKRDGLRTSGASCGFSGFVATTGNSRGLRLEKAFFQAVPEFGTTGRAIRTDLIGPGAVLIRVDAPPREKEDDPIIGAWLSFLDAVVRSDPSHLSPFQESELTALEALVEGVAVSDDDVLPEDVTSPA